MELGVPLRLMGGILCNDVKPKQRKRHTGIPMGVTVVSERDGEHLKQFKEIIKFRGTCLFPCVPPNELEAI